MSVELLQTLSTAAYIGAGILLLLAIALFFLLDIPNLYAVVTGLAAKKAIKAKEQKDSQKPERKEFTPNPFSMTRGKLTERIARSGPLPAKTKAVLEKKGKTGALKPTEEVGKTGELPTASENETSLLKENETGLLKETAQNEAQTGSLNGPGETDLLHTAGETDLLHTGTEETVQTGALPTPDGNTSKIGKASAEQAEVVRSAPGETGVLRASNFRPDETSVLIAENPQTSVLEAPDAAFSVELELSFTDSTEMIE